MSYIPYLRKPPTQTQSESALTSQNGSATTMSDEANKVRHITTNSASDPHGPRQWSSNFVKLSGKNRALNEFSVERIGEETNQNLVMLHGITIPDA